MEDYESLLNEAYKKVKVVQTGSDRFEIPPVQGMVEGKNTIITNISQIAGYVRRPVEHIGKFLQRELATSGKLENDRLVLNTKVPSIKVNEKMQLYSKEFVLCNECKKPDTEIVSEKGIKFKHCLACGAKSPVKSLI
ncbi:translation initiation factor IF-2 subunit beta [Candidatus Pacearchaeota archaeon]|nr:translation initiation factor IF-2 subunit beta [Candidatus Pacearchaeota archaeon]